MKKAAFYTLGCKVNQYETEAMSELFEKAGYKTVSFEDKADVYIINTCTVTGLSARKSRQMIRRAKVHNENSIVVVAGCYAQTEAEEASNIPGVNLVIGNKNRSKIVDYVQEIIDGRENLIVVDDIMREREFEQLKIENFKERTRAYIKIQEGCNQFCSYCIIPYARGPIRSRPPEDIMEEALGIAEAGFKEIVLTGIHIASYGKDIKTSSLIDITARVNEIKGIERIRLGSIEPTIIDEAFVNTAKNIEKLCPSFHVSLQSGCDETLKRMNRKYTTEQFNNSIRLLRDNIPDVSVTTDVMVGFPSESEEEFSKTYEFLEKIKFMRTHVFKYSPRKNTPAYSFSGQVPGEIKEIRSKKLIELSNINTEAFNKRFIGRKLPVLFEQQAEGMYEADSGNLFYEGLTPNYIRVLCKGDDGLKGKIKEVTLACVDKDYMLGRIFES